MEARLQPELPTHTVEGLSSNTLVLDIEDELREARDRDLTVGEAEKWVRTMLREKHRKVKVLREFEITDPLNFADWHLIVRFAGGEELELCGTTRT